MKKETNNIENVDIIAREAHARAYLIKKQTIRSVKEYEKRGFKRTFMFGVCLFPFALSLNNLSNIDGVNIGWVLLMYISSFCMGIVGTIHSLDKPENIKEK